MSGPSLCIIIKLLAKRPRNDTKRRLAQRVIFGAAGKAPLNINEPIQEVIALVSSDVLRSKVKLLADLAADLRSGRDRFSLQQVILNLILNAKDAMSAVQTRPRDLQITSRKVSLEK